MLAHEETPGKLGGGEARVAHSSQGLRVLCIAYVLEGLWSWSSKLCGKVPSGAKNWPRKGGSLGGTRREFGATRGGDCLCEQQIHSEIICCCLFCGRFAVDEAVDKRGMSPPSALKLAVPIGPALHGGLMVALSDEPERLTAVQN